MQPRLPFAAPESISEYSDVLVCPRFGHEARWREGEKLDQLFEFRCDQSWDRPAVDTGDLTLTYGQLDARANQLARLLLASGARPGDRIGLLFDEAWRSYVAMLAVLKINAAYVPLDVGFPADRIAYITDDAGVGLVLSQARLRDQLAGSRVEMLCLDEVAGLVAEQDETRLSPVERGGPVDELCYIIYTSGSTGRPKGVAVEHASICNFVRVAGEVYGIDENDRVYQGMTVAFDFSVEEIWVPWMAGATLVPKPGAASLVGQELWEFLVERRITALCCVPTLLATLEEELPELRFLLVSGEACPQDLIIRWHRPGRRFLNVYGPTEATVTATWTTVAPDRPVTIGVPLPTYSVVILDPQHDAVLPRGASGEIGIAGIGLARGYLNRDELTSRVFIPDFLGIDNNPSGRIYRTGDLGRVGADGHIEYLGRIDTQVKIRGYRIELTEIESVLLGLPGVAQAVVDTFRPRPDTIELVGYYTLRENSQDSDAEHIVSLLRERLPAYMVPSYLERLDVIPMTPSNKADRKNLPAPANRVGVSDVDFVAPETPLERRLCELLAEVLDVAKVSVEGDFFADLGANSLLLSRFCAQVRRHGDLPAASMRQLYQHSTIRRLAADLSSGTMPVSAQVSVNPEPDAVFATPRTWQYLLCGAAQTMVFLCYLYFYAFVLDRGVDWILTAGSPVQIYLRSVAFAAVGFTLLCTVPVLAKWLLVGRWRPGRFPIWGLRYFRFWVVRTLIRFNPMRLLVGSPLYVVYLRMLGAKIGRGVLILSQNVPICTDLLTIGAGTVIRKDTFFNCYHARDGHIVTGRVTMGERVFVGEVTTVDIDSSLGNGAQLGHTSCLNRGTSVPAGQSWHGSPAEPAGTDYRADLPAQEPRLRKVVYSTVQLLNMVLLYIPAVLIGGDAIGNLLMGDTPVDVSSIAFYENDLLGSSVLYIGGVLLGLGVAFTLPRLLNTLLEPGRAYPLYGLRYSLQRTVSRLTNSKTLTYLFGDSSLIVYYLRLLGYNLNEVEQTGSNFGVEVKHESPYLTSIGSGTMVSDGLSMINVEYSDTAFQVLPSGIGPRNFLGNNIVYPPGGRTGDNCLLATKVMIPLDGPVRENTGLLGSPPFAIPRSVERDGGFDHLKTGPGFPALLAAKNRHNLVTLAMFVTGRCVDMAALVGITLVATDLYHRYGTPATAAGLLACYLFVVGFGVLLERASIGFGRLKPRFCSIYDRVFWRHERFWKLNANNLLAVFNGTPYKVLVWRLLGVRMGRRVFDDGCAIPEKTLVTIGEDTVLNAGSVIQCHSMEDGAFKSDFITIGARCTIGVTSFVHYGVSIGDGAVIDADAFLMKGSEVEPATRWQGNPATETYARTAETASV